jgi:Methylase involved in ubiquinone/menaquinone biosynthesis
MLTIEMISALCCPSCHKGDLEAEIEKQNDEIIEEGKLLCYSCNSSYPVRTGVPYLIPDDGEEKRKLWRKHLEGLQARRQARENKRLLHPSGEKLHKAYFEFSGIDEGSVLDVGCGPGKLHVYLDEERTTYYGLDPLPSQEVRGFRYVCGLAEYLPFKDSLFSHIMINSALDHFFDLDKFFQQAIRVLKSDGKIYILQSVHEMNNPIAAIKMLAHLVKDAIDDYVTKWDYRDTPKHMMEFNKRSLIDLVSNYGEIISIMEYNVKWYAPTKLFISMRPLK